jgi:hypothetical protein
MRRKRRKRSEAARDGQKSNDDGLLIKIARLGVVERVGGPRNMKFEIS